MKKSLIVFASVLVLVACSPKLIMPVQADADRVADKFPGYTLADLQKGMALYQEKCSMCHGLKSPRSQNEAQWREIVPEMTGKANKREQRINPEEQESILRYLITMGKQD